MKHIIRILISVFVFCALSSGVFVLGFVAGSDSEVFELPFAEDKELEETILHSSGIQTKEFFDLAYEQAGEVEKVDANSAIVAHHLLVAKEIAKVFKSIESKDTERVILLSPNHFSMGTLPIQTSKAGWETPYGVVSTNDEDIDAVVELFLEAEINESTFAGEHGIGAITPFVKRSFPSATLIPIVVHESATLDQMQDLANALQETFPDAVIISSIDMSHELPEYIASHHDDVTLAALEYGKLCDGGDCLHLEIDANPVLQAHLAVNELRGSTTWHQMYRGSSIAMEATDDWRENTSHILGYFDNKAYLHEPFASLHFVGDIMLDRGVRKRILEEDDIYYPWLEMDRYLDGSHLVVGNLEGTVNEQDSTYTYNPPFRFVFDPTYVEAMAEYIDVVSLANNHSADVGSVSGQEETREWLDEIGVPWFGAWETPQPRYDVTINNIDITIIGYHQFKPNEDELYQMIQEADREGRFVIVMPHWGAEYIPPPQDSQRSLAKKMVEAGADLIIGGHPHVAQGIELIDDVPIVYSLGNFVFDQYIPETWLAMTAGVIIKENKIEIDLLPVYTYDGQPTPVSDSEAQGLFNALAEVSGDDIASQIKNGSLIVQYER